MPAGKSATIRTRPDLSERSIGILVLTLVCLAGILLIALDLPAPGSLYGQWCATLGAVLLLAPLCFVVMKRSGFSESPPTWFVTHVIATIIGCMLILVHAGEGDWLTPPGVVLLLLVFLILQGSLLRGVISRDFSLLFARSSIASGFGAPSGLDKQALQQLIDAKTRLLRDLDPGASEGLFSPALKHWLRHPWLSFRYRGLAAREARLVGARGSAGAGLAWARRIHMLVAAAFYLGLLAHVVVVLFFAGYVAGDEPITWWHITAWGR